MCRRTLVLALAGLLGAAPAQGQAEAALRKRIALLEGELRTAEAAAARTDSLARARTAGGGGLDSANAGALRVLAPAGIGAETRAGSADAWRLIDATFGDAAGRLPAQPFTLVLIRSRDRGRLGAGVVNGVLTTGTAADISQRLIWAAADALSARNDTALARWLRGALVPERDPARERRGVYVALVTTPSPAARRCYTGDLAGCRSSLGLLPVAQAVEDWYDPPGRRTVAQELDNLDQVRSAPALHTACVDDLSDAACLALLRRVPPDAVPPPLSSSARFSLVRTALQLGGRGAYTRLLAGARQPIEARLAAASGTSADSLLRVWHAGIIAAHPLPVRVEPRGGWAALGWAIAFAMLALRSTRWR